MTFEDKALELLTSNGMFQKDAEAVLWNIINDPANDAMQDRWGDHIEGYPPPMINVLWFTVKYHALEYIKEKCPRAWFRPMFEDAQEAAPQPDAVTT